MTLCLAANLSNISSSVALVTEDDVLFSDDFEATREQGALLLEKVQRALSETGKTWADIDVFAAVTGPGSFTGIRIGIAGLRGMALAADKPVAGVTSFDVVVRHVLDRQKLDTPLLVVLDSFRAELYFRLYDESGNPVSKALNLLPEDLPEALSLMPDMPIVLAGDAAHKLENIFPAASVCDLGNLSVTAGRMAIEGMKAGTIMPPVPFYVRPPDVSTAKKAPRQIK